MINVESASNILRSFTYQSYRNNHDKAYFNFYFPARVEPFVFAQRTPSFITDSLDNYVKRALEQWQIPGAAVLIVKDGKVVIEKGYGVKELGKDDKVDENTLFMIGSNTKAFTGTALAILENDGKCKLDDKVVKYLPDFNMKDEWVTKDLNLVDISTHRNIFN